nr:MAG TPA: hypothetical protein [Caudoviricetes sp.]
MKGGILCFVVGYTPLDQNSASGTAWMTKTLRIWQRKSSSWRTSALSAPRTRLYIGSCSICWNPSPMLCPCATIPVCRSDSQPRHAAGVF